MSTLAEIQNTIRKKANKQKAIFSQRFFKTGKGEYAEGDIFLGITVPELRKISRLFQDLSFSATKKFLQSKFHEERLSGLFILVSQFQKGDDVKRKNIFDMYLSQTKWINNWDLVDSSADKIVGEYLFDKDKSILKKLATSPSLWERRIAIVSTFYFIRKGQFTETLQISKILLNDPHDLIHKAVGWMLREVGKRDIGTLVLFLDQCVSKMPRTMLRYAIEKFPQTIRKQYLNL